MINKYKTVLVTGGCGFIGSHFIRYFLNKYYRINVVNVDLLTYCGNPENVKDIAKDLRYKFYKADIGDYSTIMRIFKENNVDCIVNFAAESDNNKAIHSPTDFARTNALGTAVLLESARQCNVKRFHHISTCEVFGQLSLKSREKFLETSPYRPRTPYNASKASGDLIAKSYYHTFGLPLTISYCANNYGTHQFPEKVIPVFTLRALRNEPLPVFKSAGNKREWIHVLDHCRAIDSILEKGKIGEAYNIGTGLEKTITNIADDILAVLKKPKNLKKVIPDRPGHDSRYLLDSKKIRELGWKPKKDWSDGLAETVDWYKNNPQWWRPLLAKSHSWK
ncbi:MAG: dTDP-glucose 4,6-dehydratase [Candidatus Yanofskybacteria bacterium RIFCSPHIGHO2_02_FULL_39_10]|uniref:dTDP-glucose 4,6-dehydratase n=1 Tax=Candidatus Yanofskybacteria bacterium RIFCSPHIGHO2_02_FULL_39_10 TaxID=1802674 RepID=A0A1F8FAC5_9BACT|nr:MAG: dTDP-glucose 4,6-dehydratase [Candidatus Yanofskybacteria bacterium RIFCSPHIGHO2_02_FULL_39_10]